MNRRSKKQLVGSADKRTAKAGATCRPTLTEDEAGPSHRPSTSRSETTNVFKELCIHDKTLYQVAKYLSTSWIELAIELNFTYPDISTITNKYTTEVVMQAYEMLAKWTRAQPINAEQQVPKLCSALVAIERSDIARYLDGVYPPRPEAQHEQGPDEEPMLTDPHQEAQVLAIRKSAERGRAGNGETDQVHRPARYTETIAENAEIFTKGCVSTGIPTIWKVPLDQKPVPASVMYRSYSFSKRSGLVQHHKVIMLVGATGVGKSTLIDFMINYILKVDWKDGFRFKIIAQQGEGPQAQAHGQTQAISSHTIYGNRHHNVPYTLTIIDTPGFGDTRGIEHDRAIVDQIRDFFSHSEAHNVDHIDAIGLVAQSSQARLTPTCRYVFDTILSVFGKDISPNILLLFTFCDGRRPPVINAIKEAGIPCSESMFKFNNSVLYARYVDNNTDDEETFDKMFWRMGMKSMSYFFQSLNSLEPRSLVLTKKVLEERKRLETNLMDLQPQITKGVLTLEEVQQVHQILEQHETEMQTNESLSRVIKKLSEEFLTVQKRVCFLIIDSRRILMRLEQIALKPNPRSTEYYVDLMIDCEKSEAKPGWMSRVKALEGVRNQVDILAKLNQENYDPFENYKKEFLGTTESKSWFKY